MDKGGNHPSFLADIIRFAIKALELFISKVLLAATKMAERIVDLVHEKIVEKEVPVSKDEPEQMVKMQERYNFLRSRRNHCCCLRIL